MQASHPECLKKPSLQKPSLQKPSLAMMSRPSTVRIAQPTARTIAYAGSPIKRPSCHDPTVAAALDLA
jgi:hypothetical protein